MKETIVKARIHQAPTAASSLRQRLVKFIPHLPGPEPGADIAWEMAPAGNLLAPRGFFAAARLGNTIYCCGGALPDDTLLNQVETFDIVSRTSTQQSYTMPKAWGGMACGVSKTMPAFAVFGGTRSKSCLIFNALKNSWETAPDLAVPAAAHAGVTGPGGIGFYAIGGVGYPVDDTMLATVQSFTGSSWVTSVAPLNKPRLSHAAAVANGRIYVFGGIREEPVWTVTGVVEEYDPASDSWTELPHQMPTPRYDLAVVTGSNGRIYALGGMYDCSAVDVVEEFDPVTRTWRSLTPMPTARYGHAAVATDDGRIFLLGGWRKVAGTFYVTGVIEAGTLPTLF
jgi:N-acetylneuraminic acid mutarotase